MVTIVAWLMCWYMSMSDQRTRTSVVNPLATQLLVPVPLVRVMLRIWRAATERVARSRASPWRDLGERAPRLVHPGAVDLLPLGDLLLSRSHRVSPTASTSKHNARSDP